MAYLNWSKDIVYISTCYTGSHLLMIYQSFIYTDLPILFSCYVANHSIWISAQKLLVK